MWHYIVLPVRAWNAFSNSIEDLFGLAEKWIKSTQRQPHRVNEILHNECVILVLRFHHPIIASCDHCIIQLLHHPIIASSNYCIIQLLHQPIIASSNHCIIQSLHHPIIKVISHKSYVYLNSAVIHHKIYLISYPPPPKLGS
jgi:hypothetical protein